MGYTLELSEQDMMNIAGAIQIAIKHLEQTGQNNPNIKILKNLLRKFEPM